MGAKFEDGWVWGMGAHDDKGGLRQPRFCAVEAGDPRRFAAAGGDVLVLPSDRAQARRCRHLRAPKKGVRADLCINMEHSNNTIANVCVGVVMVKGEGDSLRSCSSVTAAEAKAAYFNPIEQLAEVTHSHRAEFRPDSGRAAG